ncbi:hypothetical protein D3C86_1435460 [compost metagenome]
MITCTDRRYITIRVHNWCTDGRISKQYAPKIIITHSRTVSFVQGSCNTNFSDSCFSDIKIGIQTVIPTFVIGIGVIIITQCFIDLIHPTFINITTRCKIARCRSTTTHIEIGSVSHCTIFEQQILPIYIRI